MVTVPLWPKTDWRLTIITHDKSSKTKHLICPLWQCKCVDDAHTFIHIKTKPNKKNRAQRQRHNMMLSSTPWSLSGQLQVSFVRLQITDSSQSHREAAEPNLAKQCDNCDYDGLAEWEQRERGRGGVSRKGKMFGILGKHSGSFLTLWVLLFSYQKSILCICGPKNVKRPFSKCIKTHCIFSIQTLKRMKWDCDHHHVHLKILK